MFKRFIRSTLVLVLISTGSSALAEIQMVNTKKSKLEWFAKKVLVDKKHNGRLTVKSGSVEFVDNAPVKAELVIDMNSISCEDIESPKYNAKLVKHLKSNDFFDTSKFPTSTIVANKFKQLSGGQYEVQGELTIKGVTKPIKFIGSLVPDKAGKKIDATFDFNRTEFNVRYGSGSFFKGLGDKVIADMVKIRAELVL